MGVKTYQAYIMAEALAAAKRDLGADAVILETRSFKRGGFLGVGRKTIFELTATTADRAELSQRARTARTPRRVSRAARDAYACSAARTLPSAATATATACTAADAVKPNRLNARLLAQTLAEAHDRHQREAATKTRPRETVEVRPAPSPPAAARDLLAAGITGQYPPAPQAGHTPGTAAALPAVRRANEASSAGVARRFILTPASPSIPGSQVAGAATAVVSEPPAQPSPARHEMVSSGGESVRSRGERATVESAAMQQELSAIKTMVGQVLQRQTVSRPTITPTMPAQLFDMYLELLGQDLSEELAERIVNAVREELDDDALEDQPTVRDAVLRHLAEFVPVAEAADPPRRPDDRPLTIALIGPTGVGKTTTLAKLAATFKLRQQRKVGLVTCDTYRIAAVDQLRTYANIIGLPLKIALTPAETVQALHSLRDCDVVLIDTAGRSQNDTGRLDELRRCLAAADPHEIHLVLSSTSSEGVLLREAEAFADVGADRIVLTKLDEAVSFGVLINVMQKVGKQLSFITTGQEVPDHIEPGQPRRLAELVLGAEVHR